MKKLAALLLCLLLMPSAVLAEIEWPASMTAGQTQLRDYLQIVNEALEAAGVGVINMRYEMYSTFASLGMDGIEMPEDPFADFTMPVEIHVTMTREGVHSLRLRMHDATRFAAVAAACIHASSPSAVSMEQARIITDAYARSASAAPNKGFEEAVEPMQGDRPRAYFAYYPNQFKDHHNWLQMTLIFPLPGSTDAPVFVPFSTPMPEATEDAVWLSSDNYTHLEIFASPTPEPDSAAME